MRKLLLIFLLFSLFSGCFFPSEEECNNYCEDNVAHGCDETSSGGMWGGSTYDRYTQDCSKDGRFCIYTDNYLGPICAYSSGVCTSGMHSYCDGRTKVECFESDGGFFELNGETCTSSKGSNTCEVIDNKAECVVPVDECDPDAKSVCANNFKAKCFEENGEYYAQYDEYDDCKSQVCVEIDESAKCLTPVDSCFPNENNTCYENYVSDCYEKDGHFYISTNEYCHSQTCVELGNVEAKCLNPTGECDYNSYSICDVNAVIKCYREGNNYYYETLENCLLQGYDDCIYNPETKTARCPSDED